MMIVSTTRAWLIELLVLANFCDGFHALRNCNRIICPVSSFMLRSVPSDTADDDNTVKFVHSYVEGGNYDTELEEIEALGGVKLTVRRSSFVASSISSDPFFMDSEFKPDDKKAREKQNDEKNLAVQDPLPNNATSATNGKGPTPKVTNDYVQEGGSGWQWDGIVDEDAHLGLD